MPVPVSNRFTEFEFTNEELYGASRFTQLQLMLLQSLSAKAASNRLGLVVDPDKISSFLQAEAALKGEQDAYDYLMVLSETVEPPTPGEAQQKSSVIIVRNIEPTSKI